MRIPARKFKVERKNDIFRLENYNGAHKTGNEKSNFFIFCWRMFQNELGTLANNHWWLDQNLFLKFSIFNFLENGF